MKKLFGTDGMRGEAGKFPLDALTIEIVGASLATHLKEKLERTPLILIGRDTRESGDWLEQALVLGAATAGADSKSAGVITTPGVAFLARTLPADAGVVISASHNAYQDNGIKIFAPSGRKLDEETERLIESDVFSAYQFKRSITPNPTTANEVTSNSNEDAVELKARYLKFLASEIGQGMSLRGISLVLDCANGAASSLAPELFEQLGADVTTINNSPDGRNINLDCGSLHTEELQREVLKQNAALGVAFDGDADRALFVDSKGRLTNGDATLWVLAKYMHARRQLEHETVVATVMSNIGLEIALKSLGIDLVRTDVGDKYVLDELLRLGASLGGEQSGHIIFPKLSLAGDGMITTLGLLRAITEEGEPLEKLCRGFQTLPQILVNVQVKVKQPFAEIPSIQSAAKDVEGQLGSRGRLLLRYSGTEPLARVMIEGESQAEIEEHANKLASLIRKTLG
ncbi:MAG TPA: phosphoglucosamine mutase [Blastocatellia bacterium]|jgi:phosphoglucosamine mutase|nr:phosphoglucosamine mutase [Blastocatellia bacterium]HAF24090.1 phosphoglucosamine mutase [Blastocatellia bacterium]